MKDINSPEEKLLRLIRSKGAPAEKAGKAVPAAKAASANAMMLNVGNSLRRSFSWRRIILLTFVSACIYLAVSLAYPFFMLRNISLPIEEEQEVTEGSKPEAENTESFDSYVKDIEGRSIFSGSAKAASAPVNVAAVDAVKDINLVGIITGNNPQAIIEDKKSQKTYYITQGQSIGDIVIEEILEGKVVIGYQGQRYELHL